MTTNKLVVLGGGAAGWLTALFLNKKFPNNQITVIEDPNQSPIIAGESGGATILKLFEFLDIDLREWVRETGAMPKLGGKFLNWLGNDEFFIHGLINYGYDEEYNNFFPSLTKPNKEFLYCALAEDLKSTDLYYNAAFITTNKLPFYLRNNNLIPFDMPMWHFNSRENAAFLKKKGLHRNIQCIESKLKTTNKNDRGIITSLSLENQKNIECDWIFDCSGFARLINLKEYNTRLIDYTNLFPARSVVAWFDDTKLINHTVMTAMKYGWSWNINLKDRSGNGYVYNHDLINEDDALFEIEHKLKKKINPIASLKFQPCLLEKSWVNNSIALGLSSGFLEPLESNGLAQLVLQLELLEKFWNPNLSYLDNIPIDFYNIRYMNLMSSIIDFLLLHYKGGRQDTDFWRYHQYNECSYTESLENKLSAWRAGLFFDEENHFEVFSIESYASVAQGLKLINNHKLRKNLESRRPSIIYDFQKFYNKLKSKNDNYQLTSITINEWKKYWYGE